MRRFSAQGVVIGLSAIASTVLFTMTLVLAMTGDTAASTWTGTTGSALLAVWLVAINIRRRPVRVRATSPTL